MKILDGVTPNHAYQITQLLSPLICLNLDNNGSAMLDENRSLIEPPWQHSTSYTKPSSRFRFNLWMTILSLFYFALTLFLICRAYAHQDRNVSPSTFSSSFVRNHGLMSLDHQYDHLWRELIPKDHFVCSSDSKGTKGSNELFGKFSM